MKKRWVLWLLWDLVLAVAGMIFFFSSQEGYASMKTSNGITYWMIRLFHPGYDGLGGKEKRAIFQRFQYIVRKGAHFSEFALLGVSLRLLFQALSLRLPLPLAYVAGTLYACIDELHQQFTGNRSPMWRDVGIDSAGVLCGAALVSLILWLRRRRKEKAGAIH